MISSLGSVPERQLLLAAEATEDVRVTVMPASSTNDTSPADDIIEPETAGNRARSGKSNKARATRSLFKGLK